MRWLLPVLVAVMLSLPLWLNAYWLVDIVARSLILGIIALSLTFLATYLGLVSLAQTMTAGIAGYCIAYFGPNSVGIGIPLPNWAHVPFALLAAVLAGAATGLLAQRSRGIYAMMITLAVAVAFSYFTRQNYQVFNGFTGFSGIVAPRPGGIDLRAPVPFYFLCLATSCLVLGLVHSLVRSPLGLTIQAVRDAPRRVPALGIPVTTPLVAAFAIAGLIAGAGGVLNVWYEGRISSFSVGLGPTIDILVIAVLGGLRLPLGAFVGALCFVLLDLFAVDIIGRERFNTLIGLFLLAVVMVAPDGLAGLARRAAAFISMTTKENRREHNA